MIAMRGVEAEFDLRATEIISLLPSAADATNHGGLFLHEIPLDGFFSRPA